MRVLYVSTNFTALSHTFITREINQLRKAGTDVDLLSLRLPDTSSATHPECDLSGCRFMYPSPPLAVLAGIFRVLTHMPIRFLKALRVAWRSREDSPAQKLKLSYQLLVCCRFVPWIQERRVEHIHSHFAGSPTSFAMFLACLTGLPFTFTDHGAGLFHERIAVDTKFRRTSGISAISRFNVGFYKRIVETVPPVKIVHCGLDLNDFQYRPRGACGNPLKILAVSRLVPKKGFTYLLDALAMLDRRGVAWQGRVVGEGPLLDELRAQAAALGLSQLEFTGAKQQVEIREMMVDADVFVLPCVIAPDGDMDGIPVTLMEAMACGCPVVTTSVSGNPELVIDDRSGILLEPEDADGLADAIARLAENAELSGRLSAGGHDHVVREFNIVESARRLVEFWQEIQKRHLRQKA